MRKRGALRLPLRRAPFARRRPEIEEDARRPASVAPKRRGRQSGHAQPRRSADRARAGRRPSAPGAIGSSLEQDDARARLPPRRDGGGPETIARSASSRSGSTRKTASMRSVGACSAGSSTTSPRRIASFAMSGPGEIERAAVARARRSRRPCSAHATSAPAR